MLNDPTVMKNQHPIGEMLNNAQIVRNEEQSGFKSRLQFGEQIQHLRLDANVQCGNRFVANDKRGLSSQGAGDRDPLALSAGERPRQPVEVSRAKPYLFQ